jgi:hypothetical protein
LAVEEKDVAALRRLGLTEYESRIYLTLVRMGRKSEKNSVSVRTRFDKSQKTIQADELKKEVLKQMEGYPVQSSTLPRMLSTRPGYETV